MGVLRARAEGKARTKFSEILLKSYLSSVFYLIVFLYFQAALFFTF